MKFMRTEIKIFLVAFCLSLIAFFVTFAVGLPLVFEHSFVSSRLSPWYIVNFFYSMSLYFFLSAVLAVLIYLFVKPMQVEAKIFIITFSTIPWAFVGAVPTISLYYGNPGHPLRVITIWGNRFAFLLLCVSSFYALIAATFTVIIYRIYGFVKGLRKPEYAEGKRRETK